jgi:hypothetical protein
LKEVEMKRAVFVMAICFVTGCAAEKKRCEPPELMDEIFSIKSDGGSVELEQIVEPVEQFLKPEYGGSFGARKGDFIIRNDKIRVVIQNSSRQISPAPYGGNIIDGDIIRKDGKWEDIIGEISPFIGLSYTIDADDFDVIRDGKDGVLVFRTSGHTELLDYINLQSAVNSIISIPELNLPWDFNKGVPIYGSTYYILKSGDSHIKVWTAICNESDEKIYTTKGDIIDSGGTVSYFNKSLIVDGMGGFGYTDNPLTDLTPAEIFGFMGEESGYAIVPDEEAFNIIISGVAVAVYGTSEGIPFIMSAITGIDPKNLPPGYYSIEKGGSLVYKRNVIIFGKYSEMVDEFYKIKGIENTGSVKVRAMFGSTGVDGARIAFVDKNGRLENLLITSDGTAEGVLKEGEYFVLADLAGWPEPSSQIISIKSGGKYVVSFSFSEPAYLKFNIKGRDPNVSPEEITLPAKVSLVCIGECPRAEKRFFTDTLYDKFPEGVQVQAFVDHKGKVSVMAKRGLYFLDELPVPPGRYRVVISRGLEFSRYEKEITVSPGEHITIDATINRVVDTSGYISADMHVHSVNSPDAPVPLIDRVITFMGEGVDLLVSTDHDFITDYKPVIKSLNAEGYLATLKGEELTTFDLGHFNAYPLRISEEVYQNGAVDWAGGRGPNLTPEEIFLSLKSMGEIENPVVQVNHPRSILMGYFTSIKLDTDTLKTHQDPEVFRMPPEKFNIKEDDTGMFSPLFDAFEIYNSYDEITPVLNDYFAFLNIGLKKTGVAVSDTHHWYSSEAGVPRSLIYVGSDYDTPSKITPEVFARAIQEGRVIGTNGPFMHLWMEKLGDTKKYRMGDLVSSQKVTLHVEVRLPEWITVDTLEVFSNTPDVFSRNGKPVTTWPKPLTFVRISSNDFVLQDGQKKYHYSKDFELQKDAWFVVVIRDDKNYGDNYPMTPVLYNPDELPFAFSNAIFVDADGNGRFDPPGVIETKSSTMKEEVKEERLITEETVKELLKELRSINR